MTDTCEYVFDPDEDEENGISDTSIDSVWECPHPSHVDTDYCVFHLAPESRELVGVTEIEVRDAFVRIVEETVPGEACRFVGANFGATIIENEPFGENADVIDLRNTEFDGRFEVEGGVVESDILLDYSKLEIFSAPNVVFKGDVSFRGCHFEGRVNLDGAKFEGEVNFENATFDLNAEFSDAVFEKDVNFRHSTYKGVQTTFKNSEFRGKVLMSRSSFDKVDFTNAKFRYDADFSDASFKKETKFQYCDFRAGVRFDNSDFMGNSTFRGVKFSGDVSFEDVSYQGWVSFLNVEFENDVSFRSVWFKSEFNMVAESENNAVVDFTGARMNNASFEIEPYKPVILDFTKARIGNVSISMDGKVNNPLDNARFIETKFNGFKFSEYADYLAEKDYVIHDSVVKKDEDLPLPSLEKTYRLAAEGAKADSKDIASKFAKKEAKYRRKRQKREGDLLSYLLTLAGDYGFYVVALVVLVIVAVAGFVYMDEILNFLPF